MFFTKKVKFRAVFYQKGKNGDKKGKNVTFKVKKGKKRCNYKEKQVKKMILKLTFTN